jgi:hypothetical protein
MMTMAAGATALSAGPVAAQEASGRKGIGVGANQMLFNGPGGVQVAYDAGRWHLEGIVGLLDPPGSARPTNVIATGARFWYHLHTGGAADFSVGGGFGYTHLANSGAGDEDYLNLEAGAQIRAFIVGNVAFTGTTGLSISAADREGFALGGSLFGGLGITYYFY